MTNVQSIAGSCVWAAVAALLMLVTFEPVKVERPAKAVQFSAATQMPASNAAL